MLFSKNFCSLCLKSALGKQSRENLSIFSLSVRLFTKFNNFGYDGKKHNKINSNATKNKKSSSITMQKNTGDYVRNKSDRQHNPNHFENKKNFYRLEQHKDEKIKPKDSTEKIFNENEKKLFKLKVPDWNEIDLVEINRGFYKPCVKTAERCDKTVNEFQSTNRINVEKNAPKPILSFDELNCPQKLIDEIITAQKFNKCTSIQSQGIPIALSGKNMIGNGPMGSGKALSTILSAIIHILNQIPLSKNDGPIAVILTPTIEMADEFLEHSSHYCNLLDIKNACLSKYSMKSAGNELLITTPDLLYECLAKKTIDLHRCSFFTMYEFDRMLDLSLIEEIHQINSQTRPDCQKLIWTTISNGEIRNFAIELLNDYIRLDVDVPFDVMLYKNENIEHMVRVSEEKSKQQIFTVFIDEISKSNRLKTLVFTENRQCANKISKILQKNGYNSDTLHNNKSKEQREQIISKYHKNEIDFLVLTDTAARNLKFSNVENIINYDFPSSITDYLIRIHKNHQLINIKTKVYTIFTEENGHLVDDFIALMRLLNQTIEPGLLILQAANMDSDDEMSFAIPTKNGFQKYTIDHRL